MPWELVEKRYQFESESGLVDLGALFGAQSQLIVYHFMMGPDWEQGCPSCSFWADNFNGIGIHLQHRDTRLVAVSRAPFAGITAYARRMGWTFPWVSAVGNEFNVDFQVSPSPEHAADGELIYNYAPRKTTMTELPGISVFAKAPDGRIGDTYSCYARGLDMLNGAYHLLDLTPKGRDELGLPFPMAWLRRRDQYAD